MIKTYHTDVIFDTTQKMSHKWIQTSWLYNKSKKHIFMFHTHYWNSFYSLQKFSHDKDDSVILKICKFAKRAIKLRYLTGRKSEAKDNIALFK